MGTDKLTAQYTMERDAALRSLNEERIRAYAARYGVALPQDGETFWGAVHKARLTLACFTLGEHEVSRRWLREHGFRAEGL